MLSVLTITSLVAVIFSRDALAGEKSQVYTDLGLDSRVFTEALVLETPAASVLHCAAMCSDHDPCVTLTYHGGVCRGHDAVMTDSAASAFASGARAFQKEIPTSCSDTVRRGVTTIYPEDHTSIEVFCDQETDGGGWLVFQRRLDDSVDFYKNWADYQNSFGELNGNFWLGLDNLHMLTSRGGYELRVDLMKWDGTQGYATFSNFSISGGSDKYRLHYERFTGGTAGDGMGVHRGQQFTTKDSDNDIYGSANCAVMRRGAWWYGRCHTSNLNGVYMPNSSDGGEIGLIWRAFGGFGYSMKFAEMKFRPLN